MRIQLLIAGVALGFLASSCSKNVKAPPEKTKESTGDSRVVFIVLDGVRTEEVFLGKYKYNVKKYKRSRKKYRKYKRKLKKRVPKRQVKSRKKLMPFVWKTLAKKPGSVIIGNRFVKKEPRCYIDNKQGISLPAYADMLSARRQSNVFTNRFRGEPRYPTVFDILLNQGVHPHEIALFTSWKHIKAVASQNKYRPFKVYTGYKKGDKKPPWGAAGYDKDLYKAVVQYLKINPKVRYMFVAFNDSDEWAHKKKYKKYLKAIKAQDKFIKNIYKVLQSQKQFAAKTTLIITTDHGSGRGKNMPYDTTRLKQSKYIWAVINSTELAAVKKKKRAMVELLEGKCSHTSLGKFALMSILDRPALASRDTNLKNHVP